jgi:hypothetical protein
VEFPGLQGLMAAKISMEHKKRDYAEKLRQKIFRYEAARQKA